MLLCAYEALELNKKAINELNVFPVPDGDTGTNMGLTMSSAAQELRKSSDVRVSAVADAAASAMLRGARGNSGVILSLLFRGIAKGLKGKAACGAHDFALAMREGVDAAYKAVMKPAEGTILTVSRMASRAAVDASRSSKDVEEVLSAALAAAQLALSETTEQNPVLARAGVVDAGGMGYVRILEAFLDSLQGRVHSGAVAADGAAEDEDAHGAFGAFSTEEITFAYDTVYIMRKFRPEKPLDGLRAYLGSIGDSLVISEDDEMFKVHVHTNTPGEALTESARYGVLELAKIENMRSQHDALLAGQKPATADEVEDDEEDACAVAPPEKRYGFVAVCAGRGLDNLFHELGCDRVVTGGQTMNPSTDDILRAVNRTPAETVFVLPNNKNIIMAAEQCAPLTEKRVIVVPTRTVPQGVTCLLNLDPEAEPEAILDTFTQVMGGVHTAQVTYAARDSDFDGHHILAGEYLGLLDGALLGSWAEKTRVAEALTEAFAPLNPEFITVYHGEDVNAQEAQGMVDALSAAYPEADVTLVDGGQPVYYYMISVE
ncbi:MAG: DAK2 domain-containing protein [Oscillospiraceae bacterium]|nr:DAK2 domain-containing protein [Oscillospiraceae bacterium]